MTGSRTANTAAVRAATINGQRVDLCAVPPERNLLELLREDLDLTGTKNGCGEGFCGACTVLIDDKPEQACAKTVGDIIGREVLTVEGLASATAPVDDELLHPLQQAFVDHGAVQCGYCIPGMVLRAHGLLLRHPAPTRAQIRRAISPNLCRCTGYQQIVDAIEDASVYYRERQRDDKEHHVGENTP